MDTPYHNRRSSIAITSLMMMLASCGGRSDDLDAAIRVVDDGTAQDELQNWFNKHRQCTFVLFTDDATGLLSAPASSPAALALVEAGVLESATKKPDDPNERFYRPTPQAARWFEPFKDSIGRTEQHLCYARRDILEVSVDPSSVPSLSYVFTLEDPAPWVSNPSIQRVFPEIAIALRLRFAGSETLYVRDGKPDVRSLIPTFQHPDLFQLDASFQDPSELDLIKRTPAMKES